MAARHDQNKSAPVGDRTSYVEAYIKSIQAVEWMLKLDRLRQESAVLNMLSRHEKAQRMSYGMNGQSNFRMKRTISLPNTISNVTIVNELSNQSIDFSLLCHPLQNNKNLRHLHTMRMGRQRKINLWTYQPLRPLPATLQWV